jgi:hypothetical protein
LAVSGVNTFTVTRDNIIDAALRTLGVIGLGETPTSEDYTNCSQALNIMIKSWAKKGFPLFVNSTETVNLVASTSSYTLTNRPVRVFGGRIRNTDSVDTEVLLISAEEYDTIGDKTITGTPNQIYYDNTLTGTLYVYPVPDSTSADYTLYVDVQRMFYDMNSSSDNFDFPQEWYQALKWGLAAEVAIEYGIDIQLLSYYEQKADFYADEAFNFSVEEPSVFFTMDYRGQK